jgi:hypothetical protein
MGQCPRTQSYLIFRNSPGVSTLSPIFEINLAFLPSTIGKTWKV